MGDLSEWNPLVEAASSGKLRLVRLLVEGGADVNGCNRGGDTALLAACKSLQGDNAAGSEMLKLITFLLQNKADVNVQDQSGRTAVMLACLQRSAAVVSRLLSAGADPTLQDRCGASALVYAVNAQHPLILKMVMDACRAKGRDIIIIITTDMALDADGPKHHLTVPPSPDSAPAASCTSPSGIVLSTSTPTSAGGSVFNFRTPPKRETNAWRLRGLSEPWLTIPNLPYLRRAYESGITERDHPDVEWEHTPGVSQSLLTLYDPGSTPADPPHVDRVPLCPAPLSRTRRNTMPELTLPSHALRLPPLCDESNLCGTGSKLASKSVLFLPRPPSSAPPPSTKGSFRAALLKPRLMGSTAALSGNSDSEKCAHVRRGQQ